MRVNASIPPISIKLEHLQNNKPGNHKDSGLTMKLK